MQLLGVLNAPPPPEGMVVEELNAYVQSLSHGMEAVTTLLLSTSLTPNPGNPICGAPLHTHRNQDINFLGSRCVCLLCECACVYVGVGVLCVCVCVCVCVGVWLVAHTVVYLMTMSTDTCMYTHVSTVDIYYLCTCQCNL